MLMENYLLVIVDINYFTNNVELIYKINIDPCSQRAALSLKIHDRIGQFEKSLP